MQQHSALDRVAGRVGADPVLNNVLGSDLMWAGNRRVKLSGPDQLACIIARSVVSDPAAKVALAVPRGDRTLPALLGLYLALWRKTHQGQAGYGRMLGSVAVSTSRSELRDLARDIKFDASQLEDAIGVGRLVARPVTDQKRMRAAAVPLDGAQTFDFLDQQDSWLLFCRPNVAPPVAHQVIGTMVVDTSGCSAGSWEQTYDRNVAARRRQVWVSELGDAAYEQFCAIRNIPLVRLDWPVLTSAANRWGTGASRLASTGLSELALDRPPITALTVRHEEVEEWHGQLQVALMEMRKSARSNEDPEVFIKARVAGALLARCAFPLGRYEEAAAKQPFSDTFRQLRERIEWATATPFRGRWKAVFHGYWGLVKVCVRQLQQLLEDPEVNPKWWALQTRVEAAVTEGRRVRVLCATRADREAARTALLHDSMLDTDLLDELLCVSAFSDRSAKHTSPVDVTLLLGPPVERHARVYLAAEAGRVEVLCFPFELRRLRSRAVKAFTQYSDPAVVHDALDAIATFGPRPADLGTPGSAVEGLVVEEEGWTETDTGPADLPDDVERLAVPDPEDEFWDRALELHGTELPDEPPPPTEPEPAAAGEGAVSTRAHLVTFEDAPPMYLREDIEVTYITTEDGQPHVTHVRPSQLEPGDRIAVLPGSERGSLLAELMASWDENLAIVRMRYLPLYHEALHWAEYHAGGATNLARRVGVHPGTVSAWLRGRNRPQQPAHLRKLLEVSRVQKAIDAQAIIADYFATTRGAHRLIGRVLNECVQETIVYEAAGGDSIAKLRDLVGADLTDLLDDVHVLRVADVSPPREGVPAGVCGSFLDPDDPYLKQKGAL